MADHSTILAKHYDHNNVRFGHEQVVSGASGCLRICLTKDNHECGYSTAIASGVLKEQLLHKYRVPIGMAW